MIHKNGLARYLVVVLMVLLLVNITFAAGTIEDAQNLIDTKDIPNIKEAIASLEQVIQTDPTNGAAYWVLSKGYLYLGDLVEKDQKLTTFEAGKAYAEEAVVLLPDSADAHYWLSALIGRIGQTRGVLQSLFMVNPMKAELDRVLELDPEYPSAYFVLSLLYTEAPGWPLSIGNKEKALENASRAVELDPDNIEFKVNLAKVLINNKKTADAVKVLNDVLAMPHIDTEPDFKNEAEALLEKHSR